jgi:hypothetical protein
MHRTTHQTAEKKATQALQWQEKAPYTESPCDCESILATAFATGNQHDVRLFKGIRLTKLRKTLIGERLGSTFW